MKAHLLVFALAYVGLILGVSLFFRRRIRYFVDFFLAGRNLPAPLVYATLCAAWIGATSMLVTTDEAYAGGLGAFWIIGLPAALTVVIMAAFLAGRVRALLTLSLPDLIEERYGPLVRRLASALIIWYMILLAASQMVALGGFLKLFIGRSYLVSLAVGTGLVLFYSILGGFFTVVVTDFLHFILLSAGIIGLFITLAGRTTFDAIRTTASALGRSGYFNFFSDPKRNGLVVLSFVLAWLISPIAWQRIQAARSVRHARRALWAAAGTFVLVYALIVGIGMMALPLFGGRRLGNPLMAEFVFSQPGTLIAGLLFVAVLAAILSTMDTAINTGALSLAQDVFGAVHQRSKGAGGRADVLKGRLATLCVGALAFLVAMRFTSILKTIGLASEVMAEGLFIPGLAMLFMKKRAPLAGLLSLVLGGGFAFACFLNGSGLLALGLPPWPFSVPYGLVLSLTGFLLGLGLSAGRASGRPGIQD
jgi:SSS family solute:Na+ symporter